MANNYLVGINPSNGRLEAKQTGDTSIMAGPVELYDGNGIYGRDGSGDMLFTHSGQARSTSDYADPWTTGYSHFATNHVNHLASGLSSAGPVAIDINDGDRALYNSSWPEGGETSYVTSASNAGNQSAAWHTNHYLDEGDAVAGTVGAFGAASSIKWSNWHKASHIANTGSITIDSKAESIAGSRVQLKLMQGSAAGICASYYSEHDTNTSFDKYYDLYGNAAHGIKVTDLTLRSNASIGGWIDVTGNATFNGDVGLGNAAADTVSVNGKINTDLIPTGDGARDLGSSTLEWKDLFIDGTAHIDTLDVDANAGVDGNLTVTGTSALTGAVTVTGAVTMNGHVTLGNAASDSITFNGDTVGNITPNVNNTDSLGSSSYQYKDLWIHGTANIDSLVADTANIDGGNIDGTAIGSSTKSTGKFTTLTTTSTATIGGNTTVTGYMKATGDVVASNTSDERLKDNIKVIGNALSKVKALRGVEFDWNSKQDLYSGHDIGIIAQDVEKVAPEIVVDRDTGYKAVKYEKLVPILIEAVKELSDKLEILEGSSNRTSSF